MLQLKGLHREYQVIGIREMLIQEVEYHITCLAIVTGIHSELAKEVTNRRLNYNNGTQSVP